VSHIDEPTIWACLGTIARLKGYEIDILRVVAGKRPMCNSFNSALDIALEHDADLLLHTASDVLLAPAALSNLIERFDRRRNYVVIGCGYDAIHNAITSGGVWLFNMHVISHKFRFNNVFMQDLDFCSRVESITGLERAYTSKTSAITYHHPVWTAREMFSKIVYSLPKYKKAYILDRFRSFFQEALQLNPHNRVLKAGLVAMQYSIDNGIIHGAKDSQYMDELYESLADKHDLRGDDFYIRHKFYASLAANVLDSSFKCNCEPPTDSVPLIPWR
jgi:hypothetical protein